jgi:hypothetical protein
LHRTGSLAIAQVDDEGHPAIKPRFLAKLPGVRFSIRSKSS